MYNVSRFYGSVAQLVEQRPEEPCVAGSSPAGTTRLCMNRHFGRFFSSKFLLSTLKKQYVNLGHSYIKKLPKMRFLPLLKCLLIPQTIWLQKTMFRVAIIIKSASLTHPL